jgi:hypothetical protein
MTITIRHLNRIASQPTVLVASLTANLLLLTLLFAWPSGKKSSTAAPALSAPVALQTPSNNKPSRVDAKPASFHWRQLDAPDFPTFVKNLRSIGCPEATIQDIVQGELREIYAAKRQEVEHEIATSPISARVGLEQRLLQLRTDEDAMYTSAMRGAPIAATPPAYATAATSPANAATAPSLSGASGRPGNAAITAAAMTPAAFLVSNAPAQSASASSPSETPAYPHLDQATSQVISLMRETFAASVAAAKADPSSTVYRQRWISSQQASDDQFSSLFGGDAFIRTQLQAVQAAASAATANPNP